MQSTHVSHSEARSAHVEFVELNSKVRAVKVAEEFFARGGRGHEAGDSLLVCKERYRYKFALNVYLCALYSSCRENINFLEGSRFPFPSRHEH